VAYYPPILTQESVIVNWSPGVPVVTTQAVSGIGPTTATGNGTVVSDAGSTITERGVCWNTSGTPTTSDSKATSVGTTGAYAPSMTSLVAGTHYYVRAYAINGIGTAYGSQVEFTAITVPIVTTQAVTNISFTNGIGHGTITSSGGGAVTSSGVVWAIHTIDIEEEDWDGYFQTSPADLEGAFSVSMTGLESGIEIFVRAYAINSVGRGCGDEVSFWTSGGGDYQVSGGGDFIGPGSWGEVIGG
jgi:hypothetical protein